VCLIEALTIQLNASKRISNSVGHHRRTSSCWLRIMQSISDYVMFKIFLYSSAYKFACNAVSLGISLLTAVVICSGFATIRMPLVIPMPFYITELRQQESQSCWVSVFNRSTITGYLKRSIEYLITACLSIPI
jgi:ABC-type uncharacterized transport system fused permease/ATPase subunit